MSRPRRIVVLAVVLIALVVGMALVASANQVVKPASPPGDAITPSPAAPARELITTAARMTSCYTTFWDLTDTPRAPADDSAADVAAGLRPLQGSVIV